MIARRSSSRIRQLGGITISRRSGDSGVPGNALAYLNEPITYLGEYIFIP